MMKRIACLLLLLTLALPMTACESALRSSGTTFMCVSTETSESFSMSYEKFDGMKQYRLKTKQDNAAVWVNIETESGTLSVKVTSADKSDTLVYEAENLQTGDFAFTVPEAGKYTVTVTADEHSGSYSFDWSK